MNNQALIKEIDTLTNTRQICVIGAAIIDLVMKVERLPISGEDALLNYQNIHIGGCAFNIALCLQRLGINADNALPIGNGKWANEVKQLLTHQNIDSKLVNHDYDNGWCMALVEPSGERTFLTIEGAENQWSVELLSQIRLENEALIYLSGYQLTCSTGEKIIDWLKTLTTTFQLVIDVGPRIEHLTQEQLSTLLTFKPILTVNRQEATYLANIENQSNKLTQDISDFTQYWVEKYKSPIIIRLDSQGAYSHDTKHGKYIAAFQTDVEDTIGAGDSHAGGVLAALSAGWELADATLLGNAIASFVVGHCGADCAPTKQQLIQHIKKYC